MQLHMLFVILFRIIRSIVFHVIDFERTLQYRTYLWSLGLAVAEAMDTAQRGMGLDWEASKELIRQSIGEAKAVGGRLLAAQEPIS